MNQKLLQWSFYGLMFSGSLRTYLRAALLGLSYKKLQNKCSEWLYHSTFTSAMCSCDSSFYGATDGYGLPRLNITSRCFQRRSSFESVDSINYPHPCGWGWSSQLRVDRNKTEEGGAPPLMSWVISHHLLLSSDWDSHHRLPQFPSSPESDDSIVVLFSLHTCVSQFLIISLSRLLSPNMHIIAHWSKAELQWKFSSFILFHKRAYRKW